MTKYFFGKPIEAVYQNRFEEELKKDIERLRSRIDTREECITKSIKKDFKEEANPELMSEPSIPTIILAPIINYYVLSPTLQQRTYSLSDFVEVVK